MSRDDEWRVFQALWLAYGVSRVGNQISAFTFPIIALTVMDASPLQVGVLSAAQYAPLLLVTIHAGALSDSVPPSTVIRVGSAVAAASVLIVPVAFWVDRLSFTVLLVSALALGSARVFLDVAIGALVPRLLTGEALERANARLQMTDAGLELGGPGVSGLALRVVAAPLLLVVDAFSFLLSGVIATLRLTSDVRPESRPRAPVALLDGVRELVGARPLRDLALVAATFNVAERITLTAFLVLAVRGLGMSTTSLGLCFSAGAAGVLLGSSSGTGRVARRAGRRVMVMGLGLATIGLLLLCVGPAGPAGVAVSAVALLLHGIGTGAYNVRSVTLRQRLTPPELMGRVTAAYRAATFGVLPLGGLVAGLVMAGTSARTTVAVGAVLSFAALALVARGPLRSLDSGSASPRP